LSQQQQQQDDYSSVLDLIIRNIWAISIKSVEFTFNYP